MTKEISREGEHIMEPTHIPTASAHESHSPLPWRVTPNPMRDDGVFVTSGEGNRDYQGQLPKSIAMSQMSRANAELITRCVNSHDDLLAALKALSDVISIADERAVPEGTKEAYDAAVAAIAKAEGR